MGSGNRVGEAVEVAGASAGCLTMLVREGLGAVLYFWTAYWAYKMGGVCVAIGALFLPGIATVITCFVGVDSLGFSKFMFGTGFGLCVTGWIIANVLLAFFRPFLER